MAKREPSKTVYSSEHGRMCAHCGLAAARCACRANPRGAAGRDAASAIANSQGDGIARVSRSSRGRGGKTVTLVEGIQLPPDALLQLARDLKRHCGTGGALKGDTVEIQGDQRDTVVEALEKLGLRVKRKGG